MQRLLICLSLLVLIGTAGRILVICTAPVFPSNDLRPIRSLIAQRWLDSIFDDSESLTQLGVTEIVFERFDPDAVVLMRCGPDMQPGVAAVDDNANGIVDDASELGATLSDDVCLVQRASPDPNDDEVTLVLQHGAFVPALPSELQEPSSQWRARVRGESNGDHWSMLVEIE